MRIKLFLLIFLFSINSYGQKFSLKKELPSYTSTFLSGAADGTAETLKWKYANFEKVFPNANSNYWNPNLSWVNKYKNNNPNLGPKFIGSTTTFVWTTDGYHIMRFTKNTMLVTAIVLHPRQKRKLKHYLYDIVLHTTAYHLGFHTTYETIFR